MSDLLRETSYGPVRGFVDTLPLRKETTYTGVQGDEPALAKWLGIPYGRAERFAHVQPPVKWSQPLECYDYSPMPPQPSSFFNQVMVEHVKNHISRDQHLQADEEWATVNVIAPPDARPDENLPVLVWIYGGSLNNGSSSLFTGDPSNWLRRSIADGKRFIFVSANYRINIFGFVASEDLREADPQGLAGNYGVRDCLAIFDWVQSNIARFGGDPANVTGFGESAGAYLISQLLFVNSNPALPKRRIMRRAIMQSGAPATLGYKRAKDAFPRWKDMLRDLGIDGETAQERIDALRLVPWSELLAYGQKAYDLGGWGMTIEEGPHAIWTESTVARLERSAWDDNIEAVIVGLNEHEGSLFATQLQSPEAFKAMVSRFPQPLQAPIESLYSASSGKSGDIPSSPAAQLLGDRIFEAPCLRLANRFASKTPTYVYRLRGGAQAITRDLPYGIIHTADLHVLFALDNYWAPGSDDAKLSKTIGDAWVDFATTGDPGAGWQRFDAEKPAWLVLRQDGSTEMESIAGYKTEKLALWTKMQVEQAQAM